MERVSQTSASHCIKSTKSVVRIIPPHAYQKATATPSPWITCHFIIKDMASRAPSGVWTSRHSPLPRPLPLPRLAYKHQVMDDEWAKQQCVKLKREKNSLLTFTCNRLHFCNFQLDLVATNLFPLLERQPEALFFPPNIITRSGRATHLFPTSRPNWIRAKKSYNQPTPIDTFLNFFFL